MSCALINWSPVGASPVRSRLNKIVLNCEIKVLETGLNKMVRVRKYFALIAL